MRSRRVATVAVLGCGIDRDYPAAHRDLARPIVARAARSSRSTSRGRAGAVAFPPGIGSSRGSAHATVVVEARERSGALITADFALEDGREVMAVPGEITSALSSGRTRCYARRDAGDGAADVLEALGIEPPPPSRLRRLAASALVARSPSPATPDEPSG